MVGCSDFSNDRPQASHRLIAHQTDQKAGGAREEASAEYDAAVAAARGEAEAETSRLLENTDAAVGRIAGRILSDR